MTEITCRLHACDKPVKRLELCYAHYMRQWRYGDPEHVVVYAAHDLTGQRFGSLVAVNRVSREQHASAWFCRCDCGQNSVIPTGDLNRGSITSCGDSKHRRFALVGYGAVHDRLRNDRGRASEHQCVDCGTPAAQWSCDHTDPDELLAENIKGNPAYSLDPERYQARCIPCHKLFDLSLAA